MSQNDDTLDNAKRPKHMNIQVGSKDLASPSPKPPHSGALSGSGQRDDSGLSPESIDVIRQQYALKKFKNTFDVQLVDSILMTGGGTDLLKDYNERIRQKLLQIGEYRRLKPGNYDV